MRIWLGLLDDDIRYMNLLADYFSTHYEQQFEMILFTDAGGLYEHLSSHDRLDILLAKPSLLAGMDTFGITMPVTAYLCEEKGVSAIEGKPAVCRFQRADAIYHAILGIAASMDMGGKIYNESGAGRVVLFSGASGGVGTSTAAMAFAARMTALGTPSLYISMQQNARVSAVFSGTGASMSQLRYEVKNLLASSEGKDNLKTRLRMKMQGLLGTDASTGVMSFDTYELPLDAMDMKPDEAEAILDAAVGICGCVVVDADPELNEVLLGLISHADYTVFVSDGSGKGNTALERKLRSVDILDGGGNSLLNGEIGVIYSRFGKAGCKIELSSHVKEICEIPNFTDADEKKIAVKLAESFFFGHLETVVKRI